MNSENFTHLNADALRLITASDEVRIRHIQRDRFIEHRSSTRVLELLEDFVLRPPSVRPPCLALVGDAGSGKSTLMTEFLRRTSESTTDSGSMRVVYMVADPYPDLSILQTSLLSAMSIPPVLAEHRKQWAADELIKRAIADLGVRVVVIDEIAHIQNLRRFTRAAVFDWLKWISTACRALMATQIPPPVATSNSPTLTVLR
jgi:Cdc6-like AAA superfamily ATPase